MTIVVHCDASSKNGYSVWCYKVENNKPVCGVYKTMNIAAMEAFGAFKALSLYQGSGSKVLIVCDCLGTVKLIQNASRLKVIGKGGNLYREIRDKLIMVARSVNVDAIWVPSKNASKNHCEVDAMARAVLNEHLKGRGLL